MVSIILIGKNEGWRLKKSLESVYLLTDSYPEIDFEVIYVDSKSTDGSVELSRSLRETRVFEITGEANAAIARNIGAQESNGEILFFIDADMEIAPEFLGHALDKGRLKHECLTGHVDDYFYNAKDDFWGNNPRTYKFHMPESAEILKTTGGLMLVTKESWNKVGGMRTKYKRSQDLDFCLRLSKLGVHVYRLPYLLAKHHTIDYSHEDRMWNNFKAGYSFYPPMLFRDHLTDLGNIKRTIRANYSAFILLSAFLAICLPHKLIFLLLLLYLGIISARVWFKSGISTHSKGQVFYFFEKMVSQFLQDLFFWLGFIAFYPKDKTIKYQITTN